MATKKVEIRPNMGSKENPSYPDVLYPKTTTDMVIDESTGETVADKIGDLSTDVNNNTTELNEHLADDAPHQYGGRFEWRYNSETDSLDLVVLG